MKRIYGNWKMAQSLKEVDAFLQAFRFKDRSQVEVGIFPSLLHLPKVLELRQNWIVGAQDCSTEEKGAFTGEVSSLQIRELGVSHVLLGHSERRQRVPETAQSLRSKLKAAFKAELQPVFCVGETDEERMGGRLSAVLKDQLSVLADFPAVVLAYEPVWAIGTGKVASLEEIVDAHRLVRKEYPRALGILYGGSVKPENSAEILALPGVDGLLVGGASLKVESFLKIIESAP